MGEEDFEAFSWGGMECPQLATIKQGKPVQAAGLGQERRM